MRGGDPSARAAELMPATVRTAARAMARSARRSTELRPNAPAGVRSSGNGRGSSMVAGCGAPVKVRRPFGVSL